MTDEKIKEIERKLRKGYPQGELIIELLSEGYSQEEIQNVLFSLARPSKNRIKADDLPLWYWASIAFIIFGIAILTVKYLWIYPFGYVFLILGIIGLFVKHVFIDVKNKNN